MLRPSLFSDGRHRHNETHSPLATFSRSVDVVVPAQAGTHTSADQIVAAWIPAFAGMTIHDLKG
jgi:hypothetical protein